MKQVLLFVVIVAFAVAAASAESELIETQEAQDLEIAGVKTLEELKTRLGQIVGLLAYIGHRVYSDDFKVSYS